MLISWGKNVFATMATCTTRSMTDAMRLSINALQLDTAAENVTRTNAKLAKRTPYLEMTENVTAISDMNTIW